MTKDGSYVGSAWISARLRTVASVSMFSSTADRRRRCPSRPVASDRNDGHRSPRSGPVRASSCARRSRVRADTRSATVHDVLVPPRGDWGVPARPPPRPRRHGRDVRASLRSLPSSTRATLNPRNGTRLSRPPRLQRVRDRKGTSSPGSTALRAAPGHSDLEVVAASPTRRQRSGGGLTRGVGVEGQHHPAAAEAASAAATCSSVRDGPTGGDRPPDAGTGRSRSRRCSPHRRWPRRCGRSRSLAQLSRVEGTALDFA